MVALKDVNWLTVYTSPGGEEWTARWLGHHLGLPVVMPMAKFRERKRIRGNKFRWVDRVRPYFPNYVFSRIPYHTLEVVRSFISVSSIVHRSGTPITLPDAVVQRIAALHGTVIHNDAILVADDRVKFLSSSPLAGLEAIVKSVERFDDGDDQVTVSFKMFGSMRRVTTSSSSFQKLRPAPTYRVGLMSGADDSWRSVGGCA